MADRPDVLILGTGPAGAATAIFLLLQGLSVVLIGRPESDGENRLLVGESLSPAAGTMLRQLGVWETFAMGSHLPWNGNISYWGSAQPQYTDFIRHPCGPGWHIDREWFNELLLDRAVALGAFIYRPEGVFELEETGAGWLVAYPAMRFAASFLVDASGAAHVLSRRLRVARIKTHEQLALTAFLQADGWPEDGQSLVESAPDGWWYTAAIPFDRRVVCYFTSRYSSSSGAAPDPWSQLLGQTRFTAARALGSLLAPPRFTNAASSYSERLFGDRWVAVGDAACRYDPLTAHGLMMALTSARDAARAIGDGAALAEYAFRLKDLFLHAEAECGLMYRQVGLR